MNGGGRNIYWNGLPYMLATFFYLYCVNSTKNKCYRKGLKIHVIRNVIEENPV